MLFWLNIPWIQFNFLPTSVPKWVLESSNEVKKLQQNLKQERKRKHWQQITCGFKELQLSSLAGFPFLSVICPAKWMGDHSPADLSTVLIKGVLVYWFWLGTVEQYWNDDFHHTVCFQTLLINFRKGNGARIHGRLDEEEWHISLQVSLI